MSYGRTPGAFEAKTLCSANKGALGLKIITKQFPKSFSYLNLYVLADVHFGDPACRETEFRDYLKQIENDERSAVLLAGDLINNGIKNSVTSVYAEKFPPSVQVEMMIDMLGRISDKIVAAVGGNHERRTIKECGIDPTAEILRGVGRPETYCGDSGIIKISVGEKPNGKQATYSIYLSHGCGGGAALGSGVTKQDNYQFTIEGIDVSVTGHTHKPTKTPSGRRVFDPRNNILTQKNTLIYIATSWLNYDGYPEQMQLKAAAFYPDHIVLSGKEKKWK